MSLKLLNALAEGNMRMFSRKEALLVTISIGYSSSSFSKLITSMIKSGIVEQLGEGYYTISSNLLAGDPLHTFEIAMKITKKGAISHRTALSHYQLTDQVFSTVYVTVPKVPESNLSTKQTYKLAEARIASYLLTQSIIGALATSTYLIAASTSPT